MWVAHALGSYGMWKGSAGPSNLPQIPRGCARNWEASGPSDSTADLTRACQQGSRMVASGFEAFKKHYDSLFGFQEIDLCCYCLVYPC